jgi:hypothetical protein
VLISDIVSEKQKRRLQEKSDAQRNYIASHEGCEEAAVFPTGKSEGFVDCCTSLQFSANGGLGCGAEELKQHPATTNFNALMPKHTEGTVLLPDSSNASVI